MTVVCIDLEGVLIPEIWQAVATSTGIAELRLTTRDIADYDQLMGMRLQILTKHTLNIGAIQKIIREMPPLPQAAGFLAAVRKEREVIIVSDTFYQFSEHFMRQLDWPTLFCNDLTIDNSGMIVGYRLRQPKDGKKNVIRGLASMGFNTYATGDSYNDLDMIMSADRASLFRPPQSIVDEHPQITVCQTYDDLLRDIRADSNQAD